jgi:asparagine synthase (glutamine-hydrolysing)
MKISGNGGMSMCGIAGIIGRADAAATERMLADLRLRGPDDRGVMLEDGISLGHSRLSIIDLSERGRQPLSNEDGTLWLVFNGEIYNFRELRAHLSGLHRFRTATDSEVLLHLYEEKGPAMVRDLDGMFAFVLYDLQSRVAFLARDPLGIKPLYYLRDAHGDLLFASEIKSLISFGEEVREFPNGTAATFRVDSLKQDLDRSIDPIQGGALRFWSVPSRAVWTADPTSAVDQIDTLLCGAVRKRLVADVPVGVFLSGGLDSSLIAAIARQLAGERLMSFATGLGGCADLGHARRVADFLGTEHYELPFSPEDLIESLPDVIYRLESFDPALVRSSIPTYFVSKLAARRVKVVLSGEGADELFAGYQYLKEYAGDPAELDRELREITSDLHNTNLQRVDRMTMSVGLEGRVPFLDKALVAAAFRMHPDLKLRRDPQRAAAMGYAAPWVEKWILRRVAERWLPDEVAWRRKEKFAIGTGTGAILEAYAESQVSDADLARERSLPDGRAVHSKEELLYWRIFRTWYGTPAVTAQVGRSRSLNPGQRYGVPAAGD